MTDETTPPSDPPAASEPSAAGTRTAQRLFEIERRERQRALTVTVIAIAMSWIALMGVYYVFPDRSDSGTEAVVKLVIGVVIFVVVLGLQVRRITHARLPQLRAVEALGVTMPLFLVTFSTIYLSIGEGPHSMFNTSLDHTKALYFVVTVFSTVGFGDIVPTTDTARLIVSAQMLLDLVFIGAVVRLLFTAVRFGLERTE